MIALLAIAVLLVYFSYKYLWPKNPDGCPPGPGKFSSDLKLLIWLV